MLIHYLKVAIRNLLSHKTQTLVSLFGLAIAFACVSLASYWSYYERTYDSFQENADRVHRIRMFKDRISTPYPLHLYLKEKYPEIEKACFTYEMVGSGRTATNFKVVYTGWIISVNGVTYEEEVYPQRVTSDALDIFEFEWLEGDRNIAAYGNDKIAISEKLARNLCGTESPLGQTMKLKSDDKFELECEIVGIYKTRPLHSNLKFDIIGGVQPSDSWDTSGGSTYILLKSGVNHKQFIQKMRTDTIRMGISPKVYGIVTPLTAMRYTEPDIELNVSLEDVNLFFSSAVLLALCALLNYLTLFVSQLRNRGRDLALRAMCGSSVRQMSTLLLTEYLLLLLLASLIGILFVELAMQEFMRMVMIQIKFSSVMISCGSLMLFSVLLSIVLSVVPILCFRRKTLRVQIEAVPVRLGKDYFRSMTVCVQLVIGFLFIFCTMVMMKQVYMMTSVDNIERKQVACIYSEEKAADIIQSVLQQQPFINEVMIKIPLYPTAIRHTRVIFNCDGHMFDHNNLRCEVHTIDNEIAQFYGLKMKEGASTFDLGENEIFINEAFVKWMNLEHPIGTTINIRDKIKGVIYDYQVQNPRDLPKPLLFVRSEPTNKYVVFKYDGDRDACKNKLTEELQKKGIKKIIFGDGEEYYQSFLKSEYNLLKLLGVITVVSILIAIFGIYALIMQSCDQHRKEIAIRKVHGAGVMDILMMFFKQYILQVVVAAIIAFPIGYYLMKNWLEQYARQTSISLWIYLCIFLGISLLVTLCIGWRVWRAANENPAWVIKKE